MKVLNLAVGAALAAALAMPAAASTNLLVNGDFEANPVTPGQFRNVGPNNPPPTGWTVTGNRNNAVSLLSDSYTETNLAFTAQSGDASLDMTGGGNQGDQSSIRQSVATQIGQKYTLVFWVGNADGRRNGDNYLNASTINLAIDGVLNENVSNDALTVDGVNWLRVTRIFTARASTTTIAFRNATPAAGPSRDAFAGLDNVSLTAGVPEPATWTMMIAGFGMAGAMLRRRQRLALP